MELKQRQLRNLKISEVNERSEASREREGAYQTEDKDGANRQLNLKKSAQKHTDGNKYTSKPSYKKYNQLSPTEKQQYGNYSNYFHSSNKVKNQE